MEKFQNMVIELGLMPGLVIVLTIALYLSHRLRLSDMCPEGPASCTVSNRAPKAPFTAPLCYPLVLGRTYDGV